MEVTRMLRHLDQPTIGDESAFVYCLESCPLRFPHWRWEIALMSLRTRLPRRAETRDALVRQVRQFLKKSGTSQPPHPPRDQGGFEHALRRARAIYEGDELVRAELEALVLADAPVEMITDRCGLPGETVSTYEQVFFNVRNRLEASSFILHCVIGPALGEGFSLNDLGALWRFCGYMRGPHYLCALIEAFSGPGSLPGLATLPTSPEERARLVALGRRLVFTMCLRSADPSLSDIARLSRLWASHQHQLEEEGELQRIRDGIVPTDGLYEELHTIYSGARNIGVERSEATTSRTTDQTEAHDHGSDVTSGLAV
jgi:hypothetical protein